MAESAAYARRGHSGAAKDTTLDGGITAVATTLSGADLSTWTGTVTNGPGRATISDGTSEEEIEFTGVAGNSLIGVTRGVGGTSAQAWSSGVTLSHTSSVRDFDEANRLVNAILGISGLTAGDLLYALTSTTFARLAKGTARQQLAMNSGATAPEWVASLQSLLTAQGDIPYASAANTPARLAKGTADQFLSMNAGATAPEWVTPTAVFYTTHTWAISGTIAVPSGDTDFLVPMFVGEGANEVVVLDKVRYKINSGTSATFKMQVNGGDATGFTGLSATTTAATTDPADVALTDLDVLVPVVTAVSGTPKNLTITAFLKHTVTAS